MDAIGSLRTPRAVLECKRQMASLSLRALAKVNLVLCVGEQRPDGFHDLDSVFQAIGLSDAVNLEEVPKQDEIRVTSNDPTLPTDWQNTAYRAAALLRDTYAPNRGVHIHIEKHIPTQAGLGGGSSDAATVLLGLNQLWGLHLSREDLRPLAAAVGSDVPFFLWGGCARVRGRGEWVEPIAHRTPLWFVLAKPGFGVSTARAYADLDRCRQKREQKVRHEPTTLLEALLRGDVAAVGRALHNDLEEAVVPIHPEIAQLKQQLLDLGAAGASMSGSGSAVFGVFGTSEQAQAAAEAMADEWPWVAVAPTIGGEG